LLLLFLLTVIPRRLTVAYWFTNPTHSRSTPLVQSQFINIHHHYSNTFSR